MENIVKRKRFSFISIKTKILIICLIVVILPIFVMTVNSYLSSQRLLEQKYTELLMDIANQTNVRIDEYLKEIEKISLVASFGMNSGVKVEKEDNYPLQNYLRNDNEENKNAAYAMLMNYMMMKDREISFYVYNLNGGKDLFVGSDLPYDYSYNAKEEEWFKFFQVSNSKMMTLDTHVDQQTMSKKLAIAHARKILDVDSGTVLGIMVVRIDLGVIDVVNSRLQQALRSRFTIVDEVDNIIYNSDTSLIGLKFSSIRPDHNTNIIVESSFERQRWTTYLYMPMSELSAEGDILRNNVYVLALLMLLFLVIISAFLSNMMTRPIKKLMSNILQVEKGQFEQVEDIASRDEIGLLSTRFNRMSHELKRLVTQIQQEEKEKAAAEIRALQSQINPHFLYNTLGSVKWIASMQRADAIVEITEALIAMLRYAARAEGAMVSVREELDNLKNYMTIQQVRYYNRIRMDVMADEELLDQSMPKLILQPLVENAIFHGLAEIEEDGVVTIRVAWEANKSDGFVIEVHDNGVGMDEETYLLIEELISGESNSGSSIGLYNVKRRIELHYGSRYGVEFESIEGKGTAFRIHLPSGERSKGEIV
ncbi:sensor histidine kinase [Paenibacillus montaniterrae]|uniref:histidine kinase n=1 Tax=Paenibacillus montaniterrae TaxID=429341 RepID=A0A919YV97_9BACL|nr:sensor histidine kinase [Paenibacillus montaniterrae]GIP19156.1 sensor histidine kinase [Paenibacillus montaniterrae]